MSTESPLSDVRHLHRRADEADGDDGDDELAVEDVPGEWPEDLDISVYADSSMTIPGMGERGLNCGEWYPAEFCESCGTVHPGTSRCQQRGCPDCWATWTGNRAEAITRRLTAFRFAQDAGVDRRAVHAVASPPTGEIVSLADVKRYRRKAQERLKEAGVRGGVMVFHGFRVKADVKEAFRELKDAEAVSGGIWQFVRENRRHWRSQVYWSPHFHVIGVAREFEPVEDDWVLRRLSTADRLDTLRDDGAYESVAKMSRYILSHATFEPEGMRAVSWFGQVHATQFSPEEELSDGALSVIERKAAEAVGREDDGEGDEEDGPTCREDDCEGSLRKIWDANIFLGDSQWVDSVGREAERRLAVAFDWAIGELDPPPGLKKPRTREDFEEAFAILEENRW